MGCAEQREAGGPLDERADRRPLEPDDEVAFPVAGNRPIFRLGRPFADEDLRGHELLAAPAGAGPRDPQCPPRSQAGDKLALQRTADLEPAPGRLRR